MEQKRVWRLAGLYGPEKVELCAAQIEATEAIADEAARALLSVLQKFCQRRGWEFGCVVQMQRPMMNASTRLVKESDEG